MQLDPIPGNGKHGLGKIKEADSSIFVNLPHGSTGVDIGHGKHGVDLFGDKLLSIRVESNDCDGEKSRNNLSMVDSAILVPIVIAISNGKHRCDFSIREFLVERI